MKTAAQPELYFKEIARNAFHHLPNRIKNKLNLRTITQIIVLEKKYYALLSYAQKLKLTQDKLASILHKKLEKIDIKISRLTIKYILEAEVAYYSELHQIYDELNENGEEN
jgi:hypothetical protein